MELSSTSSTGSSKRAKAPTNPNQKVVVSCLVDECNSDLSQCREYHRRHKVCEPHSKTPIVTISGRPQRFCQQCSRFHSLEEFDEGKRSCRKRLDGHNRRRRKPQSDSLAKTTSGLFFSTPQGTRVLSFDNPQVLANSQDYAPPLVHGYKEMNQFRFTQGSATTSTNNTSNTTHDRGYKEMNKLMFCDGANGAGNSSSDHALSLLSSMPTSHSRDVGSSLVIPHAQSTMPTTNGRDLGSSHVGPHARSSQFEGVGQMLLPCYEEMENNGVVSDEESSGSRRSHNTNTNITLHF